MNISQEEVEFKKAVGKARGKTLYHLKTRGGLHIIGLEGGEILGTGSHKGIARHIARKTEPDVVWTELSKSEHIDPQDFEHLIPQYEELTQTLRKAQGH